MDKEIRELLMTLITDIKTETEDLDKIQKELLMIGAVNLDLQVSNLSRNMLRNILRIRGHSILMKSILDQTTS